MKHPETHIVTPANGPRPAGDPWFCFYCGQPIGSPHRKNCVCRKRTVVVRVAVDVTIDVPSDWDKDMIEFHYNESSSCSDNIIGTIAKRLEDSDKEPDKYHCCFCGLTEVDYVREANPLDCRKWGLEKLDPSK